MTTIGTLYLLANVVTDDKDISCQLPEATQDIVYTLDALIAENEKEGRRFLGRFRLKKPIQEFSIRPLNEHTDTKDIRSLLQPLLEGKNVGLVSDAGVPCIADPGAILVREAHKLNIPVQVTIGPCSLLLALIQSGLPAQNFAFHGYLSKDQIQRKKEITQLEGVSKITSATQLFIETPYRNEQLLQDLIQTLQDDTDLCIGCDLVSPHQLVVTKTIKEWKSMQLPAIGKRPCVFLFCARQKRRVVEDEKRVHSSSHRDFQPRRKFNQ